jgi:hypothetical protein
MQLNATANAGGMFAYTPPSGTVLNAGSNQVLTAIFTPSDPTSYTGATNTVLITVLQTNQVINFPTIPPQTVNAPPILLSATASSGLPVSYSLIFWRAIFCRWVQPRDRLSCAPRRRGMATTLPHRMWITPSSWSQAASLP